MITAFPHGPPRPRASRHRTKGNKINAFQICKILEYESYHKKRIDKLMQKEKDDVSEFLEDKTVCMFLYYIYFNSINTIKHTGMYTIN